MKLALIDWSGRFSRKEYILFLLAATGINILLCIFMGLGADTVIFGSLVVMVAGIGYLVVTVAGYGAAIRRLHDTDKSGWNVLIGFIPLINLILLYWLFFVPSKEVGGTRWG
jgi:uncharacterized membrane protein YhaH (DUF805 family)